METIQDKLKRLVTRRHPEYKEMLPHWEFLEDCYEGGREWFSKNIFRYIKEGDKEYADRVGRCYRFNHTREVVDLVDKYLFKMEASRNHDDAPDSVKKFWRQATLDKLPIRDFMKLISKLTSIYGRVWVVVDNTKTEEVTTKAEEDENDVRTYAYVVTPEHACDMSYSDDGELNWILIHEQVRNDDDPLNDEGQMEDRYRLWERNQWTLLRIVSKQGDAKAPSAATHEYAIQLAAVARSGRIGEIGTINPDGKGEWEVEVDGPHPHEFGRVPVFSADHIVSHEPYCAPSLIDDVAYLDRAVANYLSNLDAIIQDQTFSQLVIPAQGLMPGEDGYDKLIEMGTKRSFTYDGEGGGKPEYISPDVKQAELILAVISKIINEIYHSTGLAGERTKEDNSQGIDNSSGVAKGYDFERVNSLLASKADSLEIIENRLIEYVARWAGDKIDEDELLVSYPDNFDVRGLYDEFDIAARLSLVQAPAGVRRKQMESLIDKLFPKIASDLKKKMLKELKSWPPEPVLEAPGGQASGSAPAKGGTAAISKAGNNSLANKLVKEQSGK